MAIFKTKDYNPTKSDKVRLAVGKKLGLAGAATNGQVDAELEQHLRELVQTMDQAAHNNAFVPDPTD